MLDNVLDPDQVDYEIVVTEARAINIIKELSKIEEIPALDFETTGLDPYIHRVRITSICDPRTEKVYLLDHNVCGSFRSQARLFVGQTWAVYNAMFETRWFDRFVPDLVDILDVDYMAKVCIGGHPSSLAKMAKRDLDVVLGKEEQSSDWSRKVLTPKQYAYAAYDSYITHKLYVYWKNRILDIAEAQSPSIESKFGTDYDKLCWSVHMLNDAVRPTIECEETSMTLDIDYHTSVNIEMWKRRLKTCLYIIRRYAPTSAITNINSNKQVSDFLKSGLPSEVIDAWPQTEKTEQLKLDRATVQLFARRMPYPLSRWLNAYWLLNKYEKYLSTYGDTLVVKQQLADCVSYRLNIAQAKTGRYSSSNINIQNIPRNPVVRRAFLPPIGYNYFVAADYSSIEVRVLAELSGDEALIHDAIYGDVHATMAAARAKMDTQEFILRRKNGERGFNEMRSKAKAGTFRLTYGAGALAVADSIGGTLEQGEDFIRLWSQQYPKAYAYRTQMFEYMTRNGSLPICDGRRVWIPKPDRQMPVAANYPIQGAAATVMYRAMCHVKRLRDEKSRKSNIALCATVHDELILAVDNAAHIELAKEIIISGMEKAWLDVFPNTSTIRLIEAGHGKTWGDCK